MRSLYAKLLLWFLVTLTVTVVGLLIVSAYYFRDQPRSPRPVRRLLVVELRILREIYESQGADQVREHLENLNEATGLKFAFAGADGRDIVDPTRDYADIIRRTGSGRIPLGAAPVIAGRQAWYAQGTFDGRYWIIASRPSEQPFLPFFVPAHLWVIVSIALFTLLLARHLTAPMRDLQRAVDRFGQGDLAARTTHKRSDEVGQLAETFNRMADRIQTLVDSQRRLLLEMSHELRSPLARLSLAVELARGGCSGETQPALDRIQKEADKLNSLVSGLLQVTRGEADPTSVRMGPLRLDVLLKEVLADYTHPFETDIAEPVELNGNTDLLRSAIDNILRNAIRYSSADQPVQVILTKEIKLSIRDYGPGVPADALPHLFEPFYRADANPSTGFGLGLSIARRAVTLHHGEIEARNANPGFEVRISLPA
ncbi:MAG: HAMP domain-containing histidine kinase [Bryobacterales bacterium]|nr:HAMP domain-containing histidine kinase [Bryobacterales bacterium]